MTIQFRFTVGDWSADGHGMYESVYFETNSTFDEVKAANTKLNAEFPLFADWFEDYQDSQIDEDDLEALRVILPEVADREFAAYQDEIYLEDGSDGYARLWAALITHFSPNVELKKVVDKLPTIHGGGYGLFSL